MEPSGSPSEAGEGAPASVQRAESALRRLGYAKVPIAPRASAPDRANFWVQEPGVPRRLYPVFISAAVGDPAMVPVADSRPAILVVPDETRAQAAWSALRSGRRADPEVAILVLGRVRRGEAEPHWHNGRVDRKELLALATGVVVGLFRRAQSGGEGSPIDFEEMLATLRARFHVDVAGSLGVASDEDALWMMYQLALRHGYAPGDPSGNLHMLVLKPTGPAARLPWFSG